MQIMIAVVSAVVGSSAFAATAGSYLGLDLKQNRYLGEMQNSSQKANYTVIGADANFETSTSSFAYKLNPIFQNAVEGKDELYVGVPEAYMQFKSTAFDMTVGRQKRKWSRLDEEFNLGVWQPQLRWDYLAPKQQGLVGIFFDFKPSDSLLITFFTSPVYLPDQGPNFQLVDGKFSSSNRWFMQPTSRVNFLPETRLGQGDPLYYKIDRPSEESVILNSSFGAGLSYQPAPEYWMQLSYAYKPLNQIHLAIECPSIGCMGVGGVTDFNVVIHPMVVNHHVLSFETGFDNVDSKGYLSLTGDLPNSSGFQPSGPVYLESPLDSMLIAGASYQRYVFNVMGVPTWAKLSYLKVFNIRSRDSNGGVDADQVHTSLDRYPYRDIAAFEWKILASQKKSNRLEFLTRYNYSIPEQGGWLSAAVDWGMGPLTWSLGVDVLGSGVNEDSPNAGLYTRYRANDRVFGGVNYVF